MEILAHRGLWTEPGEKNTLAAIDLALQEGFGIETDVRDYRGELVIAHDIATAGAPAFADFLSLKSLESQTLALNIKADGLGPSLKQQLQKHHVANAYCFDMSGPQFMELGDLGLRRYCRLSEFEPVGPMTDLADGIWLDVLRSNWIDAAAWQDVLALQKPIAVISPELHGRPEQDLWTVIRSGGDLTRVSICTDKPREARDFFGAS